jgi:glycine dehydrogenase subunit 1
MGPDGLRQVADVSYQRAHALAERLVAIPGVEYAFPGRPFVNEFPVRMFHVEHHLANLRRAGILGGLPMVRFLPERADLRDVATFCCTEVNDPQAIDLLVDELARSVTSDERVPA